MEINLNSLISDGQEFFYWVSETEEFNKTIIYFPPGFTNGWNIHRLEGPIFPRSRIIGIDYPGRGMMSLYQNHNQITQIAKYCVDFIEAMDIENPIFIGHSFGTAVVTETIRYAPSLAKLIVLLQPGEFVGTGLHQMANLALKTAYKNDEFREQIISLYRQFVSAEAGKENVWQNHKAINEQAIAINNYQVDTSLHTNVKTLMVHSKKDELVRPRSREKLKKVFLNRIELEIDRRHTIREIDLEFYKSEILPIASDWIIKNWR